MIDLTGGQPEIVPEWILWTMRELEKRRLDDQVYLWSDDNLSTDYFWSYLTNEEREYIRSYRLYGRVCCFKGFDEHSFSFNTQAPPDEFEKQFLRMQRLLGLGLDLYCYTTFTTDETVGLPNKMRKFVDRLEALDEHLPLRTVPLKIDIFGPTELRLTPARISSISNQFAAVDAWCSELARRYPQSLSNMHISDVALRGRIQK